MKRVVLLALLALALPAASWANSVDFQFGGGVMSALGSTVSISSTVNSISINGGAFVSATGPVSITLLLSGGAATSQSITGGTVDISGGGFTFTGTITPGGTWVETSTGANSGSFAFQVNATGTLNGVPTVVSITTGHSIFTNGNPFASGSGHIHFASGDSTAATVPEPGTLGLLGTGLVGIAGMIRRRFSRAA